MNNKCVNCGCSKFNQAEGKYKGYLKCSECNFVTMNKIQNTEKPIVCPVDPMDLLACDSCQ